MIVVKRTGLIVATIVISAVSIRPISCEVGKQKQPNQIVRVNIAVVVMIMIVAMIVVVTILLDGIQIVARRAIVVVIVSIVFGPTFWLAGDKSRTQTRSDTGKHWQDFVRQLRFLFVTLPIAVTITVLVFV